MSEDVDTGRHEVDVVGTDEGHVAEHAVQMTRVDDSGAGDTEPSVVLVTPLGRTVTVSLEIALESTLLAGLLEFLESNDPIPVSVCERILRIVMQPDFTPENLDLEDLVAVVQAVDFLDIKSSSEAAIGALAERAMTAETVARLLPLVDPVEMHRLMDQLGLSYKPSFFWLPAKPRPTSTIDDFERAILKGDVHDILASYVPLSGWDAVTMLTRLAGVPDKEGLLLSIASCLVLGMDEMQRYAAALRVIEIGHTAIFHMLVHALQPILNDDVMHGLLYHAAAFCFSDGVRVLLRAGANPDHPNSNSQTLEQCTRHLESDIPGLVLIWRAAVIGSHRYRNGAMLSLPSLVQLLKHLGVKV